MKTKETRVKINKIKSWFFEKINKIDKPLARLSRRKERTKSTKLEGEVRTDNAEIQSIIRDYYKQLYGNKMDNLEKMDRFLEKLSLPRLNEEEIEIMNNLIINTEIETDQKSPPEQSPGPECFTGEFCQTFREELMPILLKLKKLQKKKHFQTHSTRPPSPWYQNRQREHTKEESFRLSLMNIDLKILNKILANKIQQPIK